MSPRPIDFQPVTIDHVLSELQKVPGAKIGQTHSFILCPFHHEKTPSGRIFHNPLRHNVGRFKCYGCGHTASWNELAKELGLETWNASPKDRPVERDVPKQNLTLYQNTLLPDPKGKKVAGDGEEDPPDHLFDLTGQNATKIGLKNRSWRGYDIDFLREEIGCKILYSGKFERFYMWLPVSVNRRIRGHIKAQLDKPKSKKIPSYLNQSGAWSLTHGLFPFDPTVRLMRQSGLSTVILVEGPRDSLR